MITGKSAASWAATIVAALFLSTTAFAEQGDDSPTGVAGIFSAITTGGLYDPYTANMQRQIDDIVVPGSVGAYPLKWTRYWNSHTSWHDGNGVGARWRFSYMDYIHGGTYPPNFPDGRQIIESASGVEETEEDIVDSQYTKIGEKIHLADGGIVVLERYNNGANNGAYRPIQLVDPYGQTTTITWITGGVHTYIDKVTEPGGRYLKVTWDDTSGTVFSHIIKVEAFDGVNSQPIQSVTYHWIEGTLSTEVPKPSDVIDQVTYSDGTSATYTYADGEYVGPCVQPPNPRGHWHAPQLITADDPRYPGPMRQIAYTYYTDTRNQTRVQSENHAVMVNGQLTVGEPVSTINGVSATRASTTNVTETRGDGATRALTFHGGAGCECLPTAPEAECPDPDPLAGKLVAFTDFLGHTTNISYTDDTPNQLSGFIQAVTDPNGHTTTYERQPWSWGITKITHPDGSTIQQTFYATSTDVNHDANHSPWYLASRTDERGNTTIYTRDSNFRITRKDYPNDPDEPASYETFTYNSFGEVLTHRLTNGGTESFVYDGRGLKTSYTDATNGTTTYSYYTSGPWTDRLKTVTHPANASGFQATETYEYDKDGSGNAIAGRGLVTKITHTDGSSVSMTYNKYGDKLTETDELGHTTTFTYDDYGRLLTATDPLGHTTTNSYVANGQASGYVTTSKLPFSTTLPSGKQTTFEYDFNWRKTAVHVAPNTSDAATTRYVYDQGNRAADNTSRIGLLTSMIDPRNNSTTYDYDKRDRQISVTDPLNHTTSFTFDAHGNKTSETHANGELIEFLQYDAMNRLRWQRVHREAGILDDTFNTYDAAGNLDTHKDENGNIYNYDYDAMNRPTQLQYPNGKTEIHTYDPAGNVQTYTNRAAKMQTFSYDNRNRQTSFTWNDGTTSQTTAYDAASRKTQIVNSDATINFQYYDDNKLLSQEEWVTATGVGDNVHRTVTYTYDADGNRASVQYPSGTKFDYDYTNRNQVADIKLDGQITPIVSYTFDAAGNIMGRSLANNTSTAYTVDAANRDTSISHSLSGGPKRFDYTYNAVDDITLVQRDSSKGDAYEYDLTQEIKRFAQNGTVDLTNGTITSPATDTNMTFDGCGNQKSLNGGGTFAVDNLNEYTTYNGAAVGNDVDGNVQTYNGWTYTYDAQNRLRQAASATVTENFYYDGLNRQVARVSNGAASTPTPNPTASPLPTALPTITPLPTVPATPTVSPSVPAISPTPTIPPTGGLTPTPSPTPQQKCSPVVFTDSGSFTMQMTTSTQGATIFYTKKEGSAPGAPTHNGSTPTGFTQVYNPASPPAFNDCVDTYFQAVAYKSGYIDSDLTSYTANYSNTSGCGPLGPMSASSSSSQNIIFSVWDGDWQVLEEYDANGNRIQGYVEGYHGLVKTLVDNIYYYQDELGSTSHIASASGALIESYQYDVYGKPRVYNASGVYQANATPIAQFLQGGARWMPELGLYDDRNRFMSPDLGRFIQPDPIGFKGDASNLYRYCGNDWANRTDPTGLGEETPRNLPAELPSRYDQRAEESAKASHTLQEKISASEVKYQANVDSQHASNMSAARAESRAATSDAAARKAEGWQNLAKSLLSGDLSATRLLSALQASYGRPPDFYNVNGTVTLPFLGRIGQYVGYSFSVTVDSNRTMYVSPVGLAFGKPTLNRASLSATANWMTQAQSPSPNQLRNFLSSWSVNGGGGYNIGGGVTYNRSGAAVGVGYYTRQLGASVNYTPESMIFGQ